MTTSNMSADGNAVSSGSGGTRNIFATRWLRNILVQTFIVGLIVFAVVYFVNNAQVNLLRRSGNFGLGFMATPGSYDPSPFFPIPLKNNDLVFRFLALGYINTIIVSLIGIFAATVLGFVMGLARLSNNWLIARAATVYVEILRNIPLAVWLLFAFALALTLPNIVASAPISGPLGLSISNEKIILPALKFGDGMGAGTWLGFAPFDWQPFKTVGLETSVMGAPLVGLLIAFGIGAAALIVLNRRQDMMRAFNDREIDTLYVWLGLLAVTVVVLLLFGANMALGIASSVVFAATAFYILIWVALFLAAFTISNRIEARERATDAPGIKSIGIIFRTVAGIVLLIYALMIETSIPPMTSWTMFWVFLIGLMIANCLATLLDIRAQDIQDRTGERPATLLAKAAIFIVVVSAIFVVLGGPIGVSVPEPNKFGRYTANSGGLQIVNGFWILVAALAIYTSAFIAETVRAGIQAVDKGQTEAARSVGMKQSHITNLIVIPQALRVIIPPLNSQYMNLMKNSSLAAIISFPEITSIFHGTILNQKGHAIEITAIIMLAYLTNSLLISAVMNTINERVKLVER
ncbi:ABC transporter permease subunit [Alphaproteobacteria bacterium]|nr:ABC transporter permease subunit [Alphaproteobacteria bacterium]